MKDCLVLYKYREYENHQLTSEFNYILENKVFQDTLKSMGIEGKGIAENGNRYFYSATEENNGFDYCEILKVFKEKWIIDRIRSQITEYEEMINKVRNYFGKYNKAEVYWDKIKLTINFFQNYKLYDFIYGFFVYESKSNLFTDDECEFMYYEEKDDELKIWIFNHTKERYESIDIHFSVYNNYL